jgi:hypothetical protein
MMCHFLGYIHNDNTRELSDFQINNTDFKYNIHVCKPSEDGPDGPKHVKVHECGLFITKKM